MLQHPSATMEPSVKHSNDEADGKRESSNSSSWISTTETIRLLTLFFCDGELLGVPKIPLDLLYWWNHSSNFHSLLINPIYTLRHVREAAAIRLVVPHRASSAFAKAYLGRRIHLPPLLLAFTELFFVHQQQKNGISVNVLTSALLIFQSDKLIAQRLEQLASNILQREEEDHADEIRIQEQHMDPKIRPQQMVHLFPTSSNALPVASLLVEWKDIPRWIAHLYYCNPITILAAGCIGSAAVPMNLSACCFQNLPVLAVVTALLESSRRTSESPSMLYCAFTLAVATYLEVHYFIFLIPMLLWQKSRRRQLCLLLWFVAFTVILQYLSLLLVGSWQEYFSVVATTHFYSFRLHHHTPSLSTIWYLSMQRFARFERYFELLLGGLPYFLLAPLTIRLYKYPSVLVAIFWMLGVLFRPPGTLYQLNLGFCFMLMNPRSLVRMMQIPSLIALCALPIPVTVYTVTYWMWLEPGNGEANFMYFQCLAYNVFVAVLFLGFCSASLRRDKAIRMTMKAMARATNRTEDDLTSKKDQVDSSVESEKAKRI
jgi:GPI transamidase subunit PIG-U